MPPLGACRGINMRLLLVEDDLALQANLKQHLLDAHYSIDVASDGEEGLFQAIEDRKSVV